ncbi:RNA-splicing ligase RtcB [Rubritalea halochordaticola]|uniref:tRNA-splicing ligase RtcB n=1 Tax=Rubritalea halochordaticola TaxID=714537 RepID=A0ABP9UZQ5_9BACT
MIHVIEEAVGFIPARNTSLTPITVIGTEAIRDGFDGTCIAQALNSREAPGVSELVLNPDAHAGYGAPVGCVMVSPTHIYPGPVGVDIKCSMSLLQTDVHEDDIRDKTVRRALIEAICERTPTGAGKSQRSVAKGRVITEELGRKVCIEGASVEVCEALGIPPEWAERCEDSSHRGHDRTTEALANRLEVLFENNKFKERFPGKMRQLGTYGGGNHFGEAEIVDIVNTPEAKRAAEVFGLKQDHVAFLSHCGSRGLGHDLASNQFKVLEKMFDTWGTPYPADDKKLVYAPLGTQEANDYLDDMAIAANFATVNHMLINALVLEAFQEVLPGTEGHLVYFISHNIARHEKVRDKFQWVHRKGATRAFPAGHFALKETPFYETGHPILLPGNPRDGSMVMAALPGAEKSCYSVNHGAGRSMGRRAAFRNLDQKTVDADFEDYDILHNGRAYPRDEAPDAYKDFQEVLASVEKAGLAHGVARLKARFVIKDASKADD